MQRPRVIRSVSTWEFMKINLVGTRTSHVHTPRDPPSAKTTIFCLGFMLLALCSSPLRSHQHSCRWELFRSNYALTRTIADMEVHHTTTDLLFSTWEKDDCLSTIDNFCRYSRPPCPRIWWSIRPSNTPQSKQFQAHLLLDTPWVAYREPLIGGLPSTLT